MGAARGPVPEGAPDVRGAPGASGTPGAASPDPLLVACALGIERLALRGAAQRAGAAVTLLRTGMGPQAAGAAVAAALRGEPVPGRTAVVATGFCAGLVPGMHPGDLVVADGTLDAPDTSEGPDSAGSTACTGTAALAAALEGLGAVHTGLLAGSGHVVRGAAREELRAATGAVAVDMESAATLAAASAASAASAVQAGPGGPGAPGRGRPGGPAASRASPASSAPAEHIAPVAPAPAGARPLAAVRVVVDAPGHELVRIGTLRGGISAFRVLHGVLPAFLEWHRSLLLPWR
ncbi:phosphorylase family protein [Streptomyces sp. NPDC054796]